FVAASECDARRRKAAGQAGAHVGDLLVEVARIVVKARDVVLVVGFGLEAVGGAAVVGPECAVGVGGLFVLAELLRVDFGDDLRAIDLVVQLLGRRELMGIEGVKLLENATPEIELGLLGRGVDLGKMGLHAATALVVGSLVAALGALPSGFGHVDVFEVGVGGRDGRGCGC